MKWYLSRRNKTSISAHLIRVPRAVWAVLLVAACFLSLAGCNWDIIPSHSQGNTETNAEATTSEDPASVLNQYSTALEKTTESGRWTENLEMTAGVEVSNGSEKAKTKMTLTSLMDVSNYSEDTPSSLSLSATTNLTFLGQSFCWDTTYENGIAHYQLTEPEQRSVDVPITPECFLVHPLTTDMISHASVSQNQIRLTLSGDSIGAVVGTVNGLEFILSDIEHLAYRDAHLLAVIGDDGTLDSITITFQASMTYQGSDIEADYHLLYQIS